MADTARTITDLLTNVFQDGQAANSITAQDMRDLIVSFQTEHCGMYISASAATTIVTPGTYVKVAGTTTEIGGASAGMTMPANNRLDYDAAAAGLPTRHFHITASMSMICASNNQNVGFALAKNGVVLPNSVIRRKIGTGADVGSMPLTWDLELSSTDYVEVWVTNETSTATVTMEQMTFSLFGHIQ